MSKVVASQRKEVGKSLGQILSNTGGMAVSNRHYGLKQRMQICRALMRDALSHCFGTEGTERGYRVVRYGSYEVAKAKQRVLINQATVKDLRAVRGIGASLS